MNRFLLDSNIQVSASYHCDQHVVKMITEESQMLSTYLYFHGKYHPRMMQPTHIHHPLVKWLLQSPLHAQLALTNLIALVEEYETRYHRSHGSARLIDIALSFNILPLEQLSWTRYFSHTEVPVCTNIPFHLTTTDKAIEEYRNYYVNCKPFARWQYSVTPAWYTKRKTNLSQ